ncbi:enoyl-CoA hydratase-related protein [Geomesophilobacter sediminis]|uniref:Enoyl-CoA hydratase/isomerase family protein n=1 Tax=Geomesophilobacter sediminis TaxID=2798584 RepID=A0A8J7ISF3_9BACT|nr:enoyl-CoA hydratase-related protein [Geomesophilobacter sediminis]MBJ6726214.1 enoyl-CoA hydratase/isomerase family protein [Geomesophilobacter sediminis]
MAYRHLLVETNEGVATLTVNRPQSLNALNSEVLDELQAALDTLEADRTVKAVVLTGAGEKAFVAGADIKEMAAMTSHQAHTFAAKGQKVMLTLERMTTPVIAAVNGFALGGGLELALGCDFIYASEKAKVGFPEVTLGIMPGFGGTQNLSRLIGANKAKELIFTGKMIAADQALAWGIVNQLCAAEDLVPKALETARGIARVGTLGVAYAKDAIGSGLDMSREDGFRYEASLFGVLFATQDQREGMAAFVEKRKAEFKGA